MIFSDIYDVYNKEYSSFVETFSCCSIDKNTGNPLVTDNTACFNFDKIRNRDYSIDGLKTTDSLYFSLNTQKIAFIEFKNTKIKGKLGEIAEKAADSLFIHFDICDKNNLLPSLNPLYYFAVFSYSKNLDKLNCNSRIAVIIARSGIGGSVVSTFSNELKKLYHIYLATKHPEIGDIICKFDVMLSNDFTSRITCF